MSDKPVCGLCGEPTPEGEEMFIYHGYSGPCPKPPLPREPKETVADWLAKQGPDSELARQLSRGCETPDVDLSWVFPIIAKAIPSRFQ